MRTTGAFLALAALVLGTAACDVTPDYLKEQGRRSRLKALGVEQFDSARAFKLAGMSTHREIQIDAARPGELDGDTLDPGYHEFHMRCGSCHAVPSPASKPGYLWEASLSRMKKNWSDAGLMPMSAEDEAAVLRFLKDHAADATRGR
ncbi:MAG: hypothetical protein AMXMBFR53_14830 [Gemmatimonadota bacterium]